MKDNVFKKYYNKTEVMYRLETGFDIEEEWKKIMDIRKKSSISLPLVDQENRKLFVVLTEELKKNMVTIEDAATQVPYDNIDENIKESVKLDVLIDEAFQSSLIEGAFTTKKKTQKMIKENLKPKDKSEKMVLNNFHALNYVMANKNKPITEETILDIEKY